jgi:hypothetical protein
MKLSKLISSMQDHDLDHLMYVRLGENKNSAEIDFGISLQAYYNVQINGTDMGTNACNYIFDRLRGYNGSVVRRCNDVHGCYRRVNYSGGGIANLRNNLNTIIGNGGYDVEANVNTRNSCA